MAIVRGVAVGRALPDCHLAQYAGGELKPVLARAALGGERTLVVGVPGAFTPICSQHHVPNLIASADRLRASGYDNIACVVGSDPFATAAWAAIMDPHHKVKFWSDGNLDFARAFGLVTRETKLFLGDCSERYMMAFRRGKVDSIRVEKHVLEYSCTRPDALLLEDS